ncbi:F0F1 ATP synthase subunit C [Candidatus Bandiella numerosa]|jgi:F-type H+-transporting ATPase subunit c|uniref:F0F1 ATP synthase subunit C n=1 Tax=Candidatus Bandiella numerosa TaxID=2570586 RepID=UPI001F025537|nr:F0F1 ATP synthase subunit C [Candidatus Bandiella numerosa]WHA05001.1 F0F1 ATP synthase subunit C [Candidatus Bandiella numerosa]
MELEALKYIGVGLTSIAMFGAAMGIGNIFAALLSGIARNPSAEDKLMKGAFIGAGLAEAMGLFAFLIALLLLFFA